MKMTTITKLIEANEIRIVSGEGAVGASEIYSGKRTIRAIKMRLTKERCGGDRWANAAIAHRPVEAEGRNGSGEATGSAAQRRD